MCTCMCERIRERLGLLQVRRAKCPLVVGEVAVSSLLLLCCVVFVVPTDGIYVLPNWFVIQRIRSALNMLTFEVWLQAFTILADVIKEEQAKGEWRCDQRGTGEGRVKMWSEKNRWRESEDVIREKQVKGEYRCARSVSPRQHCRPVYMFLT